MKLMLKPWTLADAKFVISVRNKPELMRWFRQDKPITLREQLKFMKNNPNYDGHIVYEDSKKVGVVALSHKVGEIAELCVAAPLQYHKEAVKMLLKQTEETIIVGEVFIENPALPIYLNLGFKPFGVTKYAYAKQKTGTVDTIWIQYDKCPDN